MLPLAVADLSDGGFPGTYIHTYIHTDILTYMHAQTQIHAECAHVLCVYFFLSFFSFSFFLFVFVLLLLFCFCFVVVVVVVLIFIDWPIGRPIVTLCLAHTTFEWPVVELFTTHLKYFCSLFNKWKLKIIVTKRIYKIVTEVLKITNILLRSETIF